MGFHDIYTTFIKVLSIISLGHIYLVVV